MKIPDYLKLPVFPDPEATERARILYLISISSFTIIFVIQIVRWIAIPELYTRWLTNILVIGAICLVTFVLNQKKFTRIAGLIFILSVFLFETIRGYTGAGIRMPSLHVFIVLPLVAGLVSGALAGIVVAVLCALSGLGMVLLERAGHQFSPPDNPILSVWLGNVTMIGIALSIQILATRAIRNSLAKSRIELEFRRKKEAELKRLTERFELVAEAAQLGIWDWDMRTDRPVWDARLFAMYGLEPTPDSATPYQDWRTLVHPDDLAESDKILKDAITESKNITSEFRIIRPDGETRTLRVFALLQQDESSGSLRLVGLNQDITDQKRAEIERSRLVNELRERVKELTLLHEVARMLQSGRRLDRDFFTALAQIMPAAWLHADVCSVRITFQDIDVSAPNFRLTPWVQNVRFGKAPDQGLIEIVYLEEREPQSEGPFLFEERMLLQSVAEMLNSHLETRIANTRLKQREEEFRIIFEGSALGIALVGPDGRPVASNPALERFLGYSAAELASMSFSEFTHPDDAGLDLGFFQELIDGRRDHYQMEKRYVTKSGNTVWGRLTVSMMRAPEGGQDFAIGMVEDITAQKQAEADHRKLMTQLRHSQKMQALGTLAGGIAHDFNNILMAIIGKARMARAELKDPAALDLTLDIEKAGNRAAELVRQILTASRRQESAKSVLALDTIVQETIGLLRATLPAMIRIKTDIASGLPNVSGDATQIQQVVMNLATNAVHSMGDRGLLEINLDAINVDEVFARSAPDLREGRYLRLSVSDNGSGMEAGMIERIFEPFFTTKPPGQGTGLGLSVVHGIIKNHQGAISVYSEPDKGTTFRIYFPALNTGVTIRPNEMPREVQSGDGIRILFVDDEEDIVLMMVNMMEHLGFTVTGFTSPVQALKCFRSTPDDYDVVVTDFSMPDLSGPELARELRMIRPTVHMLMTSGYLRPEDQEFAINAGIGGFLQKPFTAEELAIKLEALRIR